MDPFCTQIEKEKKEDYSLQSQPIKRSLIYAMWRDWSTTAVAMTNTVCGLVKSSAVYLMAVQRAKMSPNVEKEDYTLYTPATWYKNTLA